MIAFLLTSAFLNGYSKKSAGSRENVNLRSDFFLKILKRLFPHEWWHSTKLYVLVLHLLRLIKPLAHHRNVASLNLFCSYYFDRCSCELAELVPLPHSCSSYTSYSNRLHDFSGFLYQQFLSSHSQTLEFFAHRMVSFDLWYKWL